MKSKRVKCNCCGRIWLFFETAATEKDRWAVSEIRPNGSWISTEGNLCGVKYVTEIKKGGEKYIVDDRHCLRCDPKTPH